MSGIKKKHKNITVSGIVQGVGFRFSTKSMANSLGIKGFVKNLYNGDVYIEAEGNEVQLQHFIEWCHQGSSYSRIYDVKIKESELKHFTHFEITH
jgi:acylphosphatase